MSTHPTTSPEEIEQIHASLRQGFRSGKLKSIAYRKIQILQLGYLLQDNIERFKEAFAADLGRPSLETVFLEIDSTIGDCKLAYDRVEKWAKAEKAPFNLNFFAFGPVVRKEPKGVILNISPFNYPVWTAIGPLIGAIAAGNCVLLKPSELSANVSGLIAELVPKYMDPDVMRVVLGGVAETTKLLELRWDHILYTGGGRVAKIISAAAAKTLTPVTLELGGKSPVIIDPNCDLTTAARRIMWGKSVNAGQTCVAPDYALVPRDFEDKFVEALKAAHIEFYPKGAINSSDISTIISPGHFTRIKGLLDNTSGKVVVGGETDAERKFIAPTVVRGVTETDSLMSEELFGPILPVMPVDNVDAALEYINKHDHPLALYVFSQDAKFKSKVFDNTQSGSAIANDVIIHGGADGLPFGGIGPSGSGCHHGKYSFDEFTHLRASMDSPSWIDKILGGRFPPYTAKKESFLTSNLRAKLPSRPSPSELNVQAKDLIVATKRRWSRKWLFLLALAVLAMSRVPRVA
ncbi:Aldehyde/histidinol dehydrogenase [Hygrophoropsis aurantiaca]|uniref:Aldehyde/histidinol dehydrogenase n=1 Tax=Hygrophoropsis aurantiaca TaxID=72124 RepID=A0ACB8AQP3_9AGAM|nr:Aldehyde/histidinol dehydrogenase [Hygrophoropsis aurantiaca]